MAQDGDAGDHGVDGRYAAGVDWAEEKPIYTYIRLQTEKKKMVVGGL